MKRLWTLWICSALLALTPSCDDSTAASADAQDGVMDVTGDAGDDAAPTTCEVDCDCPQGEACASGRCVALVEPVFCCDKAGCEQGQACVDGEGRVSTCPECVVDCDCDQGQACVVGACTQAEEPVFCCDNPGCPPGQACTDVSGAASTCEKECEVDCDCPQGEICSASGLCLATAEPTYCCENSGCPLGETCFQRDGTEGTCKECEVDCDCPQGEICSASGLCLAAADPVYCCENSGCPGGEACVSRDGSAGVCEGSSVPECGDGELEGDEICDGDCPTLEDCPAETCFVPSLRGSAETCDAQCLQIAIEACEDDDGCCPEGCISLSDNDCEVECGNGIAEAGETCDGDCPTSCDAPSACFTAEFTGSADTCDLRCEVTAIEACTSGDDCCPDGCAFADDTDCPQPELCGNGQLDGGETCDDSSDSACPTTCTAPDSCTTSMLIGSAESCTAECVEDTIKACEAGDSCCPDGCSFANDEDCSCEPDSCTDRGYECGTFTDCGNSITCQTCPSGQACVDFQCVDDGTAPIGSDCTQDADCDSGLVCYPEAFGHPGGFCSRSCDTLFNACPTGNRCVNELCRPSCDSDAECRPDGYLCLGSEGSEYCAIAGTGTGDVGDPCVTSADCAGGADGFCAIELFGWKDGYCSQDCTSNADCTAGSHCGRIDSEGNGVCLLDCASDDDCRADGYLCYDYDETSPTECHAAATGTGDIGDPCDGPFDCSGGTEGFCISDVNSGWPDGHCSLGCRSSSDCGSGSHCGYFDESGDGFCLETCTSDSQCTRTGYTCRNSDGDSGNLQECAPEQSTTTSGETGAPCTSNSDCDGGTCLTDWPGGYCSSTCFSPILPCTVSTDVCTDPSTSGIGSTCLTPCDTDADCRSSYTCNSYSDLFGVTTVKACGYIP